MDRLEWIKDNLEYNEYAGMWTIEKASFSDYSGSTVERANAESLCEKYSFITRAYGSHGTEWTGIADEDIEDLDLFDDGEWENFVCTVEDLENYCVIDEDVEHRLELEAQAEAWGNWACRDFQKAVVNEALPYFDVDDEEDLPEWLLANIYDDEWIWDFFGECSEAANEYWIIETGGGAWIDVERIVKAIDWDDTWATEVYEHQRLEYLEKRDPGQLWLVPEHLVTEFVENTTH